MTTCGLEPGGQDSDLEDGETAKTGRGQREGGTQQARSVGVVRLRARCRRSPRPHCPAPAPESAPRGSSLTAPSGARRRRSARPEILLSLRPSAAAPRLLFTFRFPKATLCPSASRRNSAPRREFTVPASLAASSGPPTPEESDYQRLLLTSLPPRALLFRHIYI